jgi:hypothetical protein
MIVSRSFPLFHESITGAGSKLRARFQYRRYEIIQIFAVIDIVSADKIRILKKGLLCLLLGQIPLLKAKSSNHLCIINFRDLLSYRLIASLYNCRYSNNSSFCFCSMKKSAITSVEIIAQQSAICIIYFNL